MSGSWLVNSTVIAAHAEHQLLHVSYSEYCECCLPNVKVRLEQVLMSEPGPAILYKLGNLIMFYQGTIGSVPLLQRMAHNILGVLPVVKLC